MLHAIPSSYTAMAFLYLQEALQSFSSHAIPAFLFPTHRKVSELNACLNNAIHRLFDFHKWESVSATIFGLGRLNTKHRIMQRKVTRLMFGYDFLLFIT